MVDAAFFDEPAFPSESPRQLRVSCRRALYAEQQFAAARSLLLGGRVFGSEKPAYREGVVTGAPI